MALVLDGAANTIGGLAVGGLPDGVVDTDMVAANAINLAKLGATTGKNGPILQVLQTTKTDTFSASINKTTYSGAAISVDITPTSATSKILLIAKLTIGLESDNDIGFSFFKAGSVISGATADAHGSAARIHAQTFSTHYEQQHNVMGLYLDTAGGTSAITYDCRLRHGNNSTSGHTIYLNRDHGGGSGDMEQRSMSTLIAMEVAAA